jgi:hypothetical protein
MTPRRTIRAQTYAGEVRNIRYAYARRDFAYLALAIGSIPLFLIASAARGEAKNAINRLALSTSPEPARWRPRTPGELDIRREASRVIYALCREDLADRQHRNAGATVGDHARRTGSARRDLDVDLVRDAEARKEVLWGPAWRNFCHFSHLPRVHA